MGDSRLLQILMFKLLQYYGPLRRNASIKFSTIVFYGIIVFSSFFSGVFFKGFYGFSEMTDKEVANVISLTFSGVIAMGIFLGLRGGITALEPEIDFILTSSIKPSTYMLADLLFQYVFLNVTVTIPLMTFNAVMLHPRSNRMLLVFLAYELTLLISSVIAQTLGVMKSIWKSFKVEVFGWFLLILLFMPLLGITVGLNINYSDIPYPSSILCRYALGSIFAWEALAGFAYIVIIAIAYVAVTRINFLPDVTPLLTTALMEMPSSNRRILRFVPRIFTGVLSSEMGEKPMMLVVKLNLLRILRDGSLFTAIMLFGISTITNLSFSLVIRQVSFSALATITFNILYTPLIPAIFSINWGIIERETLWTIAVSEDGFKKYVKGMLSAYFIATFSFSIVFYCLFNILLAGTPFLIMDLILLVSITLLASILSVVVSLSLSKPSNALSLGALLYVLIPFFGAIFSSMPVIIARTTISISDTPPPIVIIALIAYILLIAVLLSRYALIRSKTFFCPEAPIEKVIPKIRFQRDFKSLMLNFLVLSSSILMIVSLMELLFRPDLNILLVIVVISLVFIASSLLQSRPDTGVLQNIPPKTYWRASQALLILLLALVLPVLARLLLLILFPYSILLTSDRTWLVLGEFAMIIPLLLYIFRRRISIEFLGLDFINALSEFKQAFLMLPFVVSIGFLSGMIVQTLLPIPPWFENIFRTLEPHSFKELINLSLINMLVIAPCEELLFRGFIQRGFESSLGANGGLLVSSILFGLFHMNPWQFLPASIVGLVIGYVFRRRKYRLWCPMALHAAYNVTLLALNYFL